MAGGERRDRGDGQRGLGKEVKGPPLDPLPVSRERKSRSLVPSPPERVRARHDGFTPARRKIFFKTLKKTGCLADACRVAGVSTNTVRRWRDKDESFNARVEAALAMASGGLEAIAFKRATEGAEEKVYRDGKLVMTRVKPSDAMLRLLMQGANAKKYGRTGRMPKKAVQKLRKGGVSSSERAATREELIEKVMKLLGMLNRRQQKAKLAQGYGVGPDGQLVPPGWRMVPDLPALPPPDQDG